MKCMKCGTWYPDQKIFCLSCGELLTQDDGQTRIGEYLIKEKIGQGGVGAVYRAIHESLNREVAVKILNEESTGDVINMQRFRREIKMHSQLKHPNIIEFLDIYEEGDALALVMELLSGCNLKEYLNHRGILPLGGVISISLSILSALEKAHKRGIIHRDLKPSNIFITDDGEAKLMDFGLAKTAFGTNEDITSSGVTVGTYLYMSPEQILGQEVGAYTDLYAFGLILYRMCTNTLPFVSTGGGEFEIMEKQVRHKPQNPKELNPNIPDALVEIILSLLEKSPDKRPEDCTDAIKRISALGKPSKLCLIQDNEGDQVRTFSDLNSVVAQLSELSVSRVEQLDTETVNLNSLLSAFLIESPLAPVKPPFDMVHPPALSKEKLKHLKTSISNIPQLPEIWYQLQAIFENPQSSAADLARVIQQDKALTVAILKTCNLPAYLPAGSEELTDIAIALTSIGMDAVQTLVLSAAMPDFGFNKKQSVAARQILFHGQAIALFSNVLSDFSQVVGVQSANMFGLLHDIGKLVILYAEPEEKLIALQRRLADGEETLTAELEVFGYSHIDAGMMLALHWKLPRKLHRFIYYHHFPCWQKPETWPPDMQAATMLVHMSHLVLSSLLAESRPEQGSLTVMSDECIWRENIRSHVVGSQSMLNNPLNLPIADLTLYSQLRSHLDQLKLAFPDLFTVS